MADAFISYSRQDEGFVRELEEALKKRGKAVWVDVEDIPLTAEWRPEILSGIEGAETFVFVISPDSITSKECKRELDHATKHNKRLVPILRREVTPRPLPMSWSRTTGSTSARATTSGSRWSISCKRWTPTWSGSSSIPVCSPAPSSGRAEAGTAASFCAAATSKRQRKGRPGQRTKSQS